MRGIEKPIGVSEYTLTKAIPKDLKSDLPTIEEIEAELSSKSFELQFDTKKSDIDDVVE